MSEVNNLAALDVANNPDGKRDKPQPAQVMEDEELEMLNLKLRGSTAVEVFKFPLAEALDNAKKGDE